MDLPPPVHTAPYSKYLKVILRSSAIDNCEESMKHAAKDLVKDGTSPNENAVSCDGTWQKQLCTGTTHYWVLLLSFQ